MAKKSNSVLAAVSRDQRWEIERDLETLSEAEKIKRDPKRLERAKALAKEKMMAMASVATEDES